MTSERVLNRILPAIIGGLVVAGVLAALIAAGVIESGEERTVVEQAPISRPISNDGKGATVSEIYERIGPGVVLVEARVQGQQESPFGFPQPNEGTASGSGFVLDKDGFILTNAHVVEGASDVQVTFGEGEPVDAEVEGTDPSTDLAVLKVDPKDAKLTALQLGDSGDAKVGDPVIAIGNPFGLDRTVTTGIVSALQREIEAPNGFSISNVIQTDASINRGNSGGPLMDGAGRVIGINSQIATGGGSGSVGIGFAVPINTAKTVIPQLKKGGEVQRAFLGVTTARITKQIADDLNLPQSEGALVQDVVEDGPADKAGIRSGRTQTGQGLVAGGDLIVKVDGREIKKPEDVGGAIADNKPGDEVEVEFLRGDERKKVEVELAKRPRNAGALGAPEGQREPEAPFPLP